MSRVHVHVYKINMFLGIAAVVRSYVSEATTEKERTGALAGVSSAQAIGFILGPGWYIEYMYVKLVD